MPVRRVVTPPTKQQVTPHQVPTWDSASRANDQINQVISQLPTVERKTLTVSLVVGANRVNHGLSGPARGCTVTPTVADATFAWSFAADGAKQAVITVVGVPQPNATVEVFR